MIAIVDYGLGNILAFANVFKRLNIAVHVARTADQLRDASKIILPGVGAFDHAMELLDQSGMRATLDALVVGRAVPVLGICVGMQILATSSEEGCRPGLGWLPGRVRALRSLASVGELPLPHMGWNDIRPTRSHGLFHQLDSGARFYFLHSYYMECEREADVAAVSEYGGEFGCAVACRNVYGVQFHPEKSHRYGMRLLQNFSDL